MRHGTKNDSDIMSAAQTGDKLERGHIGDSMIEAPEEARMRALLRKVRKQGGY